jgi:hypothetical protein
MDNKIVYMGYVGMSLEEALISYENKTGFRPTAVVARPDVYIGIDIPFLVRSKKSIAYGFMITHMATPNEIINSDVRGSSELSSYRFKPKISKYNLDEDDKKEELESESAIKNNKRNKYVAMKGAVKRKSTTTCPYCNTEIADYNNLGYWWGWKYKVRPPYWENLRLFVFKRDGHKCQNCHKHYDLTQLRCHHINPKESGGSDSARNLITLCKDCHLDEQPEYASEESDYVDLPNYILDQLADHGHEGDTNQ